MEPLLVFPESVPPELAQALDIGGWSWKAAPDIDAARRDEPADGWVGAIVMATAGSDLDAAIRFCRAIRNGDVNVDSVLLLVNGGQLMELDPREDMFDDFCVHPFHPVEFETRLKHVFRRSGRSDDVDVRKPRKPRSLLSVPRRVASPRLQLLRSARVGGASTCHRRREKV